jgi:hypothetical protein
MEQEGENMMCADGCPIKVCCLARLSDPTIIGCTIPEYTAGKIRRQEVVVWHRIREDKNDTGRSNQTRRGNG